jgi:hypothetical protein
MALRPASPVQTGDAGPSDQLLQLSSLRRDVHVLDAIVIRGSPPLSARQTSIIQNAHQDRYFSTPTVSQDQLLRSASAAYC